jgi:hypothetical protein
MTLDTRLGSRGMALAIETMHRAHQRISPKFKNALVKIIKLQGVPEMRDMKSNWLKYGLAVLVMMVIPSVGQAAKVTCSTNLNFGPVSVGFSAMGMHRTPGYFGAINRQITATQRNRFLSQGLKDQTIAHLQSLKAAKAAENTSIARQKCSDTLQGNVQRWFGRRGASVTFSGNIDVSYE